MKSNDMSPAIKKLFINKYKLLIDNIVRNSCSLHVSTEAEDHSKNLLMLFKLVNDNNSLDISQWRLTYFPGCCGLCISTGAYIWPNYRKMGLGKILNNFRQDIARAYNYTVMVCTDVETNTPQTKILEANNWEKIFSFVNKNTRNPVAMHVVNL